MRTEVFIAKAAHKDLAKLPLHILKKFEDWVDYIEEHGIQAMQRINGYRDHALVGDRNGQRSSSLSRSWRIIYTIDEEENILTVEVLEVNHHEY